MKKWNKKNGFTLLEIIIVVIIIGILASLALPRFFKTVEFSRANEALAGLSAIRRAMERCYLFKNQYNSCTTFADLDVEDPGGLTNAHFSYAISAPTAANFTITATRLSLDGGTTTDTIKIGDTGTKVGTGNFSGIK